MWRKRRLLRVAVLGTFAVLVYFTASQRHTIQKYRHRRKVSFVSLYVHRTAHYSNNDKNNNNKKYAVCSIVDVLCSAVRSTLLYMVSGL